MIGIYKITNPKGRVYIGQSKDVEKRWKDYQKLNCKGQIKLYNSLRKYGIEQHSFTVLEECSLAKLDKLERQWQIHYNVLEEGLNLMIHSGQNQKPTYSKETRSRMSQAQKGKKLTEETKQKIQNTRKERGIGKHTPETIEKISNALKKRIRKKESYEKIAQKTRGQKRTAESRHKMSQARIGKKDSLQTRKIKSLSAKNKINKGNPHSRKQIGQYTQDGTLIKNWNSISEAARHLETTPANLSDALRKNRIRMGYSWKYLNK